MRNAGLTRFDVRRLFDAWRKDPRFFLLLIASVVAILALRGIESPLGQSFPVFWRANLAQIAFLVSALILSWVGRDRGSVRCVLPSTIRAEHEPRVRARRRWSARRSIGACLVALGAGCLAFSVLDTVREPLYLDGPIALAGALASTLFGFALMETRRRSWFRDLGFGRIPNGAPWWARDGPWLLLLLAAWAVALSFRLDTRPGFFAGDEATVVIYGRMTYAPFGNEVLYSPWHTVFHPYLSCIPRSVLQSLFPDRPYYGSRLLGVIVGAATLGVVFLMVRSFFGRLAGWLAVALLGSSHVFIAFSRSGLTNLDAMFLVGLWVLALGNAWRSRRPSLGLLAGVLVGLSHYAYYGALVLLPLAPAVFVFQLAFRPRALWRRRAVWLALCLGYAMASTPGHVYNHLHPGFAKWRRETVFLLGERNLDKAFRTTETDSVPWLLAKYSWPAIGGAMLWPHWGRGGDFASGKMPIVDRDTAALFLLGLVAALALCRRRLIMILLLFWWAFVMIFGSLLTINAPYLPRIVLSLGAAYSLAAALLANLIWRARRGASRGTAIVVLAAVLGWTATTAYRNATHYYVEFAGDLDNEGYLRFPIGLAEFLRTFPSDAHMVFYSSRVYEQLHFHGLKLFDNGFSRETFLRPTPPPAPHTDKKTAYVLRLRDFPTIDQQLRRRYPEAQPLDILNPYHPDPIHSFRVYWVPAGR